LSLVLQLLRYDPATGVFTWKPRPPEMFADNGNGYTARACKIWNTRYAGGPAGSITGAGYIAIAMARVEYLAHRLAWLVVHGEPVPTVIDHKDRNPLNNRIGNLRAATQSRNLANAKRRKDNTSGIKGVSMTRTGRYDARIKANGTLHLLGTFWTLEEAQSARIDAEARLHGVFARRE
jgi:hypothetical protein